MKVFFTVLGIAVASLIGVLAGMGIPANRYSLHSFDDPTDFIPASQSEAHRKMIVKFDSRTGMAWEYVRIVNTKNDYKASETWTPLGDKSGLPDKK